MSPEERQLLENAVRLYQDNNKILKGMQRAARWGTIWGIIKIAIYVVPIVAGYIYLKPYLGTLSDTLSHASTILNQYK
jgi:hypothetical protein